SDVCSSDLGGAGAALVERVDLRFAAVRRRRSPRSPMRPHVLRDAVGLVRADHMSRDALEPRVRVLDGDRVGGDLEYLDIVDLVAEYDELLRSQAAHLDERADTLRLRRAPIVHREPVPAARIGILEQMHLDGRT